MSIDPAAFNAGADLVKLLGRDLVTTNALTLVLIAAAACTSDPSPTNNTTASESLAPSDASVLSDYDQVEQIAIDEGLACSGEDVYKGAPFNSCISGNTMLVFTIGPGFDGVKELRDAAGTCPPQRGNTHGWIWAGDGYLVFLYREGEPNETELAIRSAFGSLDPTCDF